MKSVFQKLSIPVFLGLFVSGVYFSRQFPDPYVIPQQFWFLIFTSLLFGGISILSLFQKKVTSISFDRIDFIYLIFTLFVLLNYMVRNGFANLEQEILQCVFYFFTYVFIKFSIKQYPNLLNNLLYVIVFLSLIQAIYGLLQLAGILPNYMEGFKIGGSFGNPAQYANFLASIIPFALGIPLLEGKTKYTKSIKLFFGGTFFLILLVLFFTNARTAWIAAAIGIFLLLNKKYAFFKSLFWASKSLLIKISVITLLSIITIVFIFKLFYFKEDSSYGRLFIWETTLSIIKENPVCGTGNNSFAYSHNNQQALYFSENPLDIKNSYLADNVLFAYNDFWELTSENGLVGLLLFLTLIFYTLSGFYKSNRKMEVYPFFVAMLGIMVMALFSYPFRSIGINLIFITCLAVLSVNETGKIYTIKLKSGLYRTVLILLAVAFFFIFSLEVKRYKLSKEWNKASIMASQGESESAINIYQKIFPELKYNGTFLYNYGAELSIIGNYRESLEVLKLCERKINDADFYNYLGNTYEGLNNLEEAEKAYLQASNIIPHKLYPKYRLVYIYAKMNNAGKALELAKQILKIRPKVESDITVQIKKDMEAFLKDNNAL